jgi:hypothetical protein
MIKISNLNNIQSGDYLIMYKSYHGVLKTVCLYETLEVDAHKVNSLILRPFVDVICHDYKEIRVLEDKLCKSGMITFLNGSTLKDPTIEFFNVTEDEALLHIIPEAL